MEDVVKALGLLTLGTRLKRVGERLQAQTQAVIEAEGVDLPSSHLPVLATLQRLGPLTVGDIALALGVSQPGVTRQLGKLQEAGLVIARQSAGDLRLRTIELTEAGQRHVAHAWRYTWPAIEAAVAEACAPHGPTLLALLQALEEALDAQDLLARVNRHPRAAAEPHAPA
ncbi:MAG: MarR family transcriptional regulator [Comamonadaceae bacterium]|uniref:MarR family transcriptional regulator n=1 Tax=Hydrogenophaga borbori TaxID=2294117 RepID=A0A372EQG7_9BURK|nr:MULTISPECIES: MarR family transcriptional regulator [Hydrogenophaga]NCT96110.1 MarR family transcriptional regulator [Comamonadaceae bacterium]RFP82887.1 MarR family transcriptional regulator [Hydrogenophaga borbori]WQB81644.1 MarR family transcriptional regulator [Hydrogenophaga sp. SNF1]